MDNYKALKIKKEKFMENNRNKNLLVFNFDNCKEYEK